MAVFTPDIQNEMFQLAIQFVNRSDRNIFLTGKAGTGKTTFLKYIRENCLKQLAVVAPTGVAAINAGGVTIHSFFQLPLSPFIPEIQEQGFQEQTPEISTKHSLLSRLRFSSEKKKVLQQLELLVIDEISMVRSDTLDAIDTVLRYIRQQPAERFGGVQVLFIGDMLQLPPVIKEQEWSLLSDYYKGPYFFDSKVLESAPPVYIEFNKIYRQRDEQFIGLLNQIRNNELDQDGFDILENRFQPMFRRQKNDGFIILTTHNNKAAEINIRELSNLDSKLYSYEAEVRDEFSDRAFPAEEQLQLKVGAQVMFIRNDLTERGKRYYNGMIGVVSKLEENKIFVQCLPTGPEAVEELNEIEVQQEKWENIRYTVNKSTRQLDSDVLGSFTQFPLRLAWAITIHKSQGLTFNKAIIDAGEAFAPGQVYVALSRCTNLDGMILKSRVKSSSLFNDRRIIEFSKQSASPHQLEEKFASAGKHYQQAVLISTFNFSTALNTWKELIDYLLEHSSSFNSVTISWVEVLSGKLEGLQETALKFHLQLQFLFQQTGIPEENRALQERLTAASVYFSRETDTIIQAIKNSPVITDSRLHAKEFNENVREIAAELSVKKYLMEGFSTPFKLDHYHHQRKNFVLPVFSVNAYAGAAQKGTDSPNPELHQQLRKVRERICAKRDLPVYIVAGSNTIDEMARYLPHTLIELRKISGFGDVKIKQYGQQFLDVIIAYCNDHNLTSLIMNKTGKKEPTKKPGISKMKGDTYRETFDLYKKGNSIPEIAKARSLTIGTIETHLSKFLRTGEIKIEELILPEKLEIIESAIQKQPGDSLTAIKQQLGSEVSFWEIRMVKAGLGFTSTNEME